MPRPPCAAHTYCDYSRHCCHWCAEHTYYRCCDYSFQDIICRLLRARHYIYHPYLFCGRGVPRPYKALRKQGYKHYLLLLQAAHELQMLRLFIPKHHCRLLRGEALYLSPVSILRARRASPLQSLAEARLRTRFYCHYRSASLKFEAGHFQLPTFYLREAEARRAAIHNKGSSAWVSQ